MTTYIGTATSRVDGLAKVTGAAKYASEFNTADLAHASVVTTPIAKGRITRIDASEALSVAGVIDVLTHRNRPRMASADSAYKDDTAPEGSPFRPLYDDRIWFSGQPVAVVVAEEPEVARFAASLVRVEYEEEAHVTDLYRQRDAAVALEPAENPFAPPKPRGRAERALTAAQVRHRGEYFVPIEHHNPMELYTSTVIFEPDGKLTIYDKTQGVQNVQRYLCSMLEMETGEVRVLSPFVGGAFGSGLRPQYQGVLAALAARALRRSVRLVLTRQQMYGLGYRPAMIQQIELGANAAGILQSPPWPRCSRRNHAEHARGRAPLSDSAT
jgi:xanthine dehydrogenase YagR molybdenum-binding subunit